MSAGDGTTGRREVLAIVPAFNEAGSIAEVVSGVRALDEPMDVLVLDDGSTDDTEAVARSAGADVVRMPYNCGIGANVQAGLAYALRHGYSLLVRLDGDGQHNSRDVPRLLSTLRAQAADFVLGSRYLEGSGYQSTALRRLGARWFSVLLRVFCGLKITDPTSGFWAANRRAAQVMWTDASPDYPEVDSLVSLERNRCVIRECPVTMRERGGGQSSIQGFKALYYMLKVTIALLIGRVRSRSS